MRGCTSLFLLVHLVYHVPVCNRCSTKAAGEADAAAAAAVAANTLSPYQKMLAATANAKARALAKAEAEAEVCSISRLLLLIPRRNKCASANRDAIRVCRGACYDCGT